MGDRSGEFIRDTGFDGIQKALLIGFNDPGYGDDRTGLITDVHRKIVGGHHGDLPGIVFKDQDLGMAVGQGDGIHQVAGKVQKSQLMALHPDIDQALEMGNQSVF